MEGGLLCIAANSGETLLMLGVTEDTQMMHAHTSMHHFKWHSSLELMTGRSAGGTNGERRWLCCIEQKTTAACVAQAVSGAFGHKSPKRARPSVVF
jgi:hypothetical protein